MDPLNPSLFSMTANCLPCCTTPTEGCSCYFLDPSDPEFPYPNYDYANGVINRDTGLNAAISENCLVWLSRAETDSILYSFTDNVSVPNTLIIQINGNPAGATGIALADFGFLFSAPAGSELWINLSVANGNAFAGGALFQCLDQGNQSNPLDENIEVNSLITIPEDGTFALFWQVTSEGPNAEVIHEDLMTVEITCSNFIQVHPVVVFWDESNVVRRLEGCPKMLLPPLTEFTADWYVSENAAQNAIDNHSNLCYAYCYQAPDERDSFEVFSADEGFIYIESAATATPGPPEIKLLMGVSRVFTSENLFVDFDVTSNSPGQVGGTLAFQTNIYDMTTDTPALGFTNTINWPAGPQDDTFSVSDSVLFTPNASGKYYVETTARGMVSGGNSVSITTFSMITSNNTFAPAFVQGLVDIGLDCPGRLNCNNA